MTRSSITIYEAEKISYADIPSYKSRLKNKGFNLNNICISPSCIYKGYYAITAIKEGWQDELCYNVRRVIYIKSGEKTYRSGKQTQCTQKCEN